MKKGMLVGLVLGLVVASGAALGALRNGNPAPVEADSLAGEVVYVKLNANWKTNSPRFAAYAFVSADTTQSLWVDMSLTANETDIYQAFIQDVAAFDTVIFCRMDPTKTENNWDNKWNQTGDLTYTASLGPLYTLTEGSWDSGTWGAYDGLPFEVDEYPVIDGTFTPSEMRVEYASATKPFTPTNSPRKGFVF
jgi:hypothetical protein